MTYYNSLSDNNLFRYLIKLQAWLDDNDPKLKTKSVIHSPYYIDAFFICWKLTAPNSKALVLANLHEIINKTPLSSEATIVTLEALDELVNFIAWDQLFTKLARFCPNFLTLELPSPLFKAIEEEAKASVEKLDALEIRLIKALEYDSGEVPPRLIDRAKEIESENFYRALLKNNMVTEGESPVRVTIKSNLTQSGNWAAEFSESYNPLLGKEIWEVQDCVDTGRIFTLSESFNNIVMDEANKLKHNESTTIKIGAFTTKISVQDRKPNSSDLESTLITHKLFIDNHGKKKFSTSFQHGVNIGIYGAFDKVSFQVGSLTIEGIRIDEFKLNGSAQIGKTGASDSDRPEALYFFNDLLLSCYTRMQGFTSVREISIRILVNELYVLFNKSQTGINFSTPGPVNFQNSDVYLRLEFGMTADDRRYGAPSVCLYPQPISHDDINNNILYQEYEKFSQAPYVPVTICKEEPRCPLDPSSTLRFFENLPFNANLQHHRQITESMGSESELSRKCS